MMIRNIILILLIFTAPVFAFELDGSVDDEIRKNYNPSVLEEALPALPKVKPSSNVNSVTSSPSKPPKTLPVIDSASSNYKIKQSPINSNIDKSTAIRIKGGTKFKVKSSANISDKTPKGARLTFTTLYPVSQRFITIPQGTQFKAVVTNSHPPQITGNGGLIEIKVDSVIFKGYSYIADGKVTKANGKKIFVNNIKGERKYWKGVAKQIQKGQNFYKKTRRVSNKLTDNPITLIAAPFPTIFGMGVYAVNLAGSPFFSIGSKGGRISIPAGREFEIKLLEDIYLQN